MADRKAFSSAMALLAETFNKTLSKPLLDAYWGVLGELTDQELAGAASRALAECRFFPVPSELLAFARPPRTLEARAASAWIAVRSAIRRYDYTVESIDFGPLVNTVLRAMGSWEWLCELGDEAMKWEAKRFSELFSAFAVGPETSLRPEPIGGWGRGKVGCIPARVVIDGELPPIDPSRAIKAPPSPMRDLVRELAEAKSQPGEAEVRTAGVTQPSSPPLPLREKKPPTRITDEEKAAAIARIAAQLENRGATP
jgi:hypothetical protein